MFNVGDHVVYSGDPFSSSNSFLSGFGVIERIHHSRDCAVVRYPGGQTPLISLDDLVLYPKPVALVMPHAALSATKCSNVPGDIVAYDQPRRHSHKWKSYVGLTKKYEYCDDGGCTEKRNEKNIYE